jgi:hypothetical protein
MMFSRASACAYAIMRHTCASKFMIMHDLHTFAWYFKFKCMLMILSSLWFQVHNDFKFKCMLMFMSSSACLRFQVMNSSYDFKLCFQAMILVHDYKIMNSSSNFKLQVQAISSSSWFKFMFYKITFTSSFPYWVFWLTVSKCIIPGLPGGRSPEDFLT